MAALRVAVVTRPFECGSKFFRHLHVSHSLYWPSFKFYCLFYSFLILFVEWFRESSRRFEFSLRGHEGVVWALCMTPEGRLASGGGYADRKIRIWK